MDYRWAERAAEKYLEENNLLQLPVDPVAIAEKHEIIVEAKQASDVGVSGMLIKYGNIFGIAYATHIDVEVSNGSASPTSLATIYYLGIMRVFCRRTVYMNQGLDFYLGINMKEKPIILLQAF